VVESLLLSVTQVTTTNAASETLTNATGFFFERAPDLFLITNRHVVLDEPSGHRPHGLRIELHTDPENVAATASFSIPLYEDERPVWTEVSDTSGTVDVVAIQLDRSALPEQIVYEAFTPEHLVQDRHGIEVGTTLLIVGFPLGFHDALHHLPVARQAVIASAFGMRFEGNGYFLTDARLHRGTSGAPVVTRVPTRKISGSTLQWLLLGVHAARLDVGAPDLQQDERLGLNCAWYADALLTLTVPRAAETPSVDEPV
jgi:S1-C subfamily serine protease